MVLVGGTVISRGSDRRRRRRRWRGGLRAAGHAPMREHNLKPRLAVIIGRGGDMLIDGGAAPARRRAP